MQSFIQIHWQGSEIEDVQGSCKIRDLRGASEITDFRLRGALRASIFMISGSGAALPRNFKSVQMWLVEMAIIVE